MRGSSVRVSQSQSYAGITATEVAISAFDLHEFVALASGKRLALVVEGVTDQAILYAAWSKLRPNVARPFIILPATGAKSVQNLIKIDAGRSCIIAAALSGVGVNRVVELFDFDGEGYSQWNGAIKASDAGGTPNDHEKVIYRKHKAAEMWAVLLPVPSFRKSYASLALASRSILTIELLFPDLHISSLLTSEPIAGVDNQAFFRATDAQKRVIADAVVSFPLEAFTSFEPLIGLLESLAF